MARRVESCAAQRAAEESQHAFAIQSPVAANVICGLVIVSQTGRASLF